VDEVRLEGGRLEADKEDILEGAMEDYGDKLTKLAYGYVKDWGMAEAVVQEVFVKCYHNLHKFRGDSSLHTSNSWFNGIITNHNIKSVIVKKNEEEEKAEIIETSEGFKVWYTRFDV
jgi:DNA-directed RNA polymerase specialized sigma24 family protein